MQNGSKQSEDKDDFKSNAFKLEHVPFGEVAHAPPQVSLKRRNHVDERGGGSRHGLALQKHLQAGEAKLLMGKQVSSVGCKALCRWMQCNVSCCLVPTMLCSEADTYTASGNC